jgi:ANTAR domain/PAS fold
VRVPATTEVMLSHKHPDDRARALSVLEAAVETAEPFSCYHRIIDRNERVRSVLSVGHGIKGTDGRVARVEGYFVDLTQVRRDETEAEVQTALARVAEHREAIDEIKGMIMIATGCDSDAAFACLRRYSQEANMKVHDIAHQLVAAVSPSNRGSDLVRPFFDDLVGSSRRPRMTARALPRVPSACDLGLLG